jgi:hypothetical protein
MTKTFTVAITDDNIYEGINRETIGLTLSGQSGNVLLGSQQLSAERSGLNARPLRFLLTTAFSQV